MRRAGRAIHQLCPKTLRHGNVLYEVFHAVKELVGEAKKLNLNTVAQTASFRMGYERVLLALGTHQAMGHESANSALTLFFGGGASLPFDPKSSALTFKFPGLCATPQTAALKAGDARPQDPAACTPAAQRLTDFLRVDERNNLLRLAAAPAQISFVTPDRNNFFREYSGGLRLYSLYKSTDCDGCELLPGTVEFSVGQNEQISGGQLRGWIANAQAAYPLPIRLGGKNDNHAAIYIFGRTSFRLNSASQVSPLLLDVPEAPTAGAPGVLIGSIPAFARPNRRDIYTIGIGFDAFRLAKKIFNP